MAPRKMRIDIGRNSHFLITPRALFVTVLVLCCELSRCQTVEVDVVESKAALLKCRFDSALSAQNPAYYWIRANKNEKDNVAIEGRSLDNNYEIDFSPTEGKYDLRIRQAAYDRDNGKFECKLKETGSGKDLHSSAISLTVLIPPKDPKIAPIDPVATEGTKIEMTCSSTGGSPSPDIVWFRNGGSQPLEAQYKKGETRDVPTSSILSINPTKEDDGAKFTCEVWNRARPEGSKLSASTKLEVNYLPRMTITPYNPLLIERGKSMTVSCDVDAKPPATSVRWTRAGQVVSRDKNLVIQPQKLEDSGSYYCEAENGLGGPRSQELVVDILYAPVVHVEKQRESDPYNAVSVQCNISANPSAADIEWLKEGDDYFRQTGDTLRFDNVKAEDTGRYTCRAVNHLRVSGSEEEIEGSGNATVMLWVKHKPGKASITPAEPIASEGESFSMTCQADPPGWPEPTYKWWKEGSNVTLSLGQRYTITTARVGDEGIYHCKPSNALGEGSVASVNLRVFEPPQLMSQLEPQVTKKAGAVDFTVSCSAKGSPAPRVRWLKDGINELTTGDRYDIGTRQSDYVSDEAVESTLKFIGPARPMASQLTAEDRGTYTCQFENEVKQVATTMILKIEHEPVDVDSKVKVAFDLGEVASLECRIQAYPQPQFEWSFNNQLVGAANDQDHGAKYDNNVTSVGDDVYSAILRVQGVRREDLGEYTCKAANDVGDTSVGIRLQQKGPPEHPVGLEVMAIGYDFATLRWTAGFDGGIANTTFSVHGNSTSSNPTRAWDCQTNNPCNLTDLEQHTSYTVLVQAHNMKGKSEFSEKTEFTTKANVNDIPATVNVEFNKGTGMVNVRTWPFNLPLVGKLEANVYGQWVQREETVRLVNGRGSLQLQQDSNIENVRVILCLEESEMKCGPPHEAIAPITVAALSEVEIVGISVGCVVFALLVVAAVILMCYCNRRGSKEKQLKKDYEMEAANMRPKVISPPSYRDGIVNKAADHSMESEEQAKEMAAGYPMHLSVDGQMLNGHVGSGGYTYLDRDNTHSNNGGSIDSQDSLWMKANGDLSSDRTYPAYDQTGNGYVYHDDYHHMHEDIMNQRNREHIVNGDPYAAVNKLKKRGVDPIDSPYHDVSGLPDPYMDDDEKPPHVSLSFDESLESGYSTPNSRSRRVIREIIV